MSWVNVALTVLSSVLASSGLWAYIAARRKTSDASTKLLLGLAHDRIVNRGMLYINRGYITFDEYEDFMKYLCEPYSTFDGNGLAEKVIAQVKALQIVSHRYDDERRKARHHERNSE